MCYLSSTHNHFLQQNGYIVCSSSLAPMFLSDRPQRQQLPIQKLNSQHPKQTGCVFAHSLPFELLWKQNYGIFTPLQIVQLWQHKQAVTVYYIERGGNHWPPSFIIFSVNCSDCNFWGVAVVECNKSVAVFKSVYKLTYTVNYLFKITHGLKSCSIWHNKVNGSVADLMPRQPELCSQPHGSHCIYATDDTIHDCMGSGCTVHTAVVKLVV